MMVRLDRSALTDTTENPASAIGVEGDRNSSGVNKVSEVDKILGTAKKVMQDGHEVSGVSGSNSGKGHDPVLKSEVIGTGASIEQMERVVEEDPSLVEGDDANEMTPSGVQQVDPAVRAQLKGMPLMNEGGSALLMTPDWSPTSRGRADSDRSNEAP